MLIPVKAGAPGEAQLIQRRNGVAGVQIMIEQGPTTGLSSDEIREICGDMLDWKLNAIMALAPEVADLLAAVAWVNRQDDLGEQGRPLDGVSAEIYDLLVADEEFVEEG